MAADRWDRLAPLTGVVFVVLTVIGIALSAQDQPDFMDPPGEIVQYFTDNSGALIAAGWIGVVGGFFMLWFIGTLASRLRAAEGGAGRVATIALAGGVVAAVAGILSDTVLAAGGLRVDEQDTIPAATATTFYDAQTMLIGVALPVGLAVLIAATGVVALRTGVLPRWLGVVSLVLALGLLILPIAWALTAVALLWVLVVSVLLYLRPAPPAAGATPAETGRTSPA